jgi:ADP-heptose:LPS heptosyltransferase
VIGGDTGPVHLSSALGVPTIAIFGGSDINETSPVSKNSRVIARDIDCSPCRGRPSCEDYPCLTSIKPEEVFGVVGDIIKIG